MRKRPRQDRSAFTVDVILESATRLLGKEGRTATTNRIADLAGVSIGSIYQYFSGRQEILDEIARRHLRAGEDAVFAVLERNPVGTQPWQIVLEEVIDVVVAANRSHGAAHGRLRHLVSSPALVAEYELFLNRLSARLAEYLVDDGRSSDQAHRDAVLACVGVDAQVHLLVQSPELDHAEIVRHISDYTVRALTF